MLVICSRESVSADEVLLDDNESRGSDYHRESWSHRNREPFQSSPIGLNLWSAKLLVGLINKRV
jgi:hypothetical protein